MCPNKPVSVIPAGEWTHSQEEDVAGIQVYRRTESFPFPPTRGGRDSFRVSADGQIEVLSPGPDDRPRSTGNRVHYQTGPVEGSAVGGSAVRNDTDTDTDTETTTIQVVEATPTVIKIRRQ